MGSSVSKVRDELKAQQAAEKAQIEQRLDILEKMVHGRLDKEQEDILQGRRGNQEIQTGTIVEMHRQINITDSTKQDLDKCLTDSIGDFFKGDFLGGFQQLVKVGADTVLGNASVGEYETTDMFIIWNSNALIRCDTYYYRWNFTSSGVINDSDGCAGVLLVKRIIDATKVDPQVLTWAITNQVMRNMEMESENPSPEEIEKRAAEVIDSAMKILEKVVEFQVKVKLMEDGKSSDSSSP
uniref:Uncharacterized protein n=1 Tax=Amphimedon queenslandica TaxID=400682 RepID=A0A1X7SXG0_AMPQE